MAGSLVDGDAREGGGLLWKGRVLPFVEGEHGAVEDGAGTADP